MVHHRSSLHAHLCRHRHRIEFRSSENFAPASRAAEGNPRRPRSHSIGGRRLQRRTAFAGGDVGNGARVAALQSCHTGMRDGFGKGGGNGGAARCPQFAHISGVGTLDDGLDDRNHFRTGRGPPHSSGHYLGWPRGRSQRSADGPRRRQLRAHAFARGTNPGYGELAARGRAPDRRISSARPAAQERTEAAPGICGAGDCAHSGSNQGRTGGRSDRHLGHSRCTGGRRQPLGAPQEAPCRRLTLHAR